MSRDSRIARWQHLAEMQQRWLREHGWDDYRHAADVLREHGIATYIHDGHGRAIDLLVSTPSRVIIGEEPIGEMVVWVTEGDRPYGEQVAGWFPEKNVLVVEDSEMVGLYKRA